MANKIKIHNAEEETVIERDMNSSEQAAYNIVKTEYNNDVQILQDKETKKAIAIAKLAALGLTEDDVKALGI